MNVKLSLFLLWILIAPTVFDLKHERKIKLQLKNAQLPGSVSAFDARRYGGKMSAHVRA